MTKKYLCICDWGQVRSVAMAQFIHELNINKKNGIYDFNELKYEAIPIGEKVSSKQTMNFMTLQWADEIIDVRKYLPEDIWRNSRHPDLIKKVEEIWQRLEAEHHSD